MSRQCTAGGFEVIPEQAQQYDPFKVLCFCGTLFLGTGGTVIHYQCYLFNIWTITSGAKMA